MLLRNILLKGGDRAAFVFKISALASIVLVAVAAAYGRFRQTLN